jgi:uncharacterized phage protein (TIGR02218 family)
MLYIMNGANKALGYTKIVAQNTQNPIGELFATMQSSSDKAVAGMIKGTETWHQSIAAGDSFSIYPGCDKQQSTCQNKFANLINFRRFPYIPENSTAV